MINEYQTIKNRMQLWSQSENSKRITLADGETMPFSYMSSSDARRFQFIKANQKKSITHVTYTEITTTTITTYTKNNLHAIEIFF